MRVSASCRSSNLSCAVSAVSVMSRRQGIRDEVAVHGRVLQERGEKRGSRTKLVQGRLSDQHMEQQTKGLADVARAE
jgi:hypothetical protein